MNLSPHHRLPVEIANDRLRHDLTGTPISHHERFVVFAKDPFIPPFPQSREDWQQRIALLRESVLVTFAVLADIDTLENSVFDQMSETLGQDISGDPEVSLEVRKASKTKKCVADDQQTPPIAEHIEAPCDTTILVFESCAAHDAEFNVDFKNLVARRD